MYERVISDSVNKAFLEGIKDAISQFKRAQKMGMTFDKSVELVENSYLKTKDELKCRPIHTQITK